MNIYLLYVICGSLGGFLGGLLGLGGGIVFVPMLFFIFNNYDINSAHMMQSAVSTSLACVVISSMSAAIKHNKNKLVNWDIFYKMLPGITIGSLLGVILITVLSSGTIKLYYGLLLILISLYLIFEKVDKKNSIVSKKEYKLIISITGLGYLFSKNIVSKIMRNILRFYMKYYFAKKISSNYNLKNLEIDSNNNYLLNYS